jgi:anti-anti-sigma factor
MELSEAKEGGVTVLTMSGRLDGATAPATEEKVLALINGGADRLVIDCAGLDYISSAGLRILLMAAKRLTPPRGKLALAAPKPQVRDVLDIAGFASLLAIHPTRSAAVKYAGS